MNKSAIPKYTFVLLGAAILVLAGPSFVEGRLSDEEAVLLVKADPCAKSLSPDSRLLRITRDEDSEDDFFSFQIKSRRALVKEVEVFRVASEGYFVLSPDELVHVNNTGLRFAYFAVTRTKRNVYPLYGCSAAERSFSQLISDLRILVSSEKDAADLALLQYSLTRDPENKNLIQRPEEFVRFVDDRLSDWYGEGQVGIGCRKWLDPTKFKRAAANVGVKASRDDEKFTVSVTIAQAERKRAEIVLQKLILMVDRTGVISPAPLRVVLSVTKHGKRVSVRFPR